MSEHVKARTNQGFGRFLVVVYAIFAVGATARSVIQITRRLDEAPVAYVLSAFAAVVYIVATLRLLGEIGRRGKSPTLPSVSRWRASS